jgi:hypothetical protein
MICLMIPCPSVPSSSNRGGTGLRCLHKCPPTPTFDGVNIALHALILISMYRPFLRNTSTSIIAKPRLTRTHRSRRQSRSDSKQVTKRQNQLLLRACRSVLESQPRTNEAKIHAFKTGERGSSHSY